jgi:hypothetical protein
MTAQRGGNGKEKATAKQMLSVRWNGAAKSAHEERSFARCAILIGLRKTLSQDDSAKLQKQIPPREEQFSRRPHRARPILSAPKRGAKSARSG